MNYQTEYQEIKQIIDNFQGTEKQLRSLLKPHIEDQDYFDFYYKHIEATIYINNGKFTLSDNYSVYNQDYEYIGECKVEL